MRWVITETGAEVTWADAELEGPPWLIEDIEALARSGEWLTPIPGTLIPAGLIDPLEAWATVTVALSEHRDQGAVKVPSPPEQLGPTDQDLVF